MKTPEEWGPEILKLMRSEPARVDEELIKKFSDIARLVQEDALGIETGGAVPAQ